MRKTLIYLTFLFVLSSCGETKTEEPQPVPPSWTPVSSVNLSQSAIELLVGESMTLTAEVLPADAENKTVTWESSNTDVASVKDGLVTAISNGSAIITASAGGRSATCIVYVSDILVSSIILSDTSIELNVGQNKLLTAEVLPADAENKTVTWESSNTDVASVKDGLVTAISNGSAIITASAGGRSATCIVYVSDILVSSIILSDTSIELNVGQNKLLTAELLPNNASQRAITWTSSDTDVASVKDGLVTAVGGGSAVITASVADKSATCSVTVFQENGGVNAQISDWDDGSTIEGKAE